ncbi:MAG: branched-chain amino acid ABC transporter permease [Desulfobulbus propionicus]|nr:MAG: branched-chain amino acid ABC transporter permease [Desulfobulbus propionicus]
MEGAKTKKMLCLGGVVVAVQVLASLSGSQYYLTQLTMAAYYGLVVIGLAAVMGYAGQISIGHAGFFAIGGYISAAMTTSNLMPGLEQSQTAFLLHRLGFLMQAQDMYGETLLVFTPWAAGVTAVSVAALVAFFLGIPVLKLKGHYLAMATLGFGTIVYRLVLATPLFGEADGISEVPAFPLLPAFGSLPPVMVSGDGTLRIVNYYIAWVLLMAGMLLLLNLLDSRVGRALRALHTSEEAAESSGINTARCKLSVFVISAVYASLAGVFLTHYNGGIGPSEASVMKSVRYVALVAVGGMTNLWGALLAGVVLTFLSLRGVFGSYDDAVFGLILIGVMLFAPKGMLDLRALFLPAGKKEPKGEGTH